MTIVRPSYDLERYRAEIPMLRSAIPMNNCSHSPQTTRTRAAADAYLDSWNERGMDWDGWIGDVEAARAEFARLIHASPDEIAIASSVSEAMSVIASAVEFGGERRTIVASEGEFPTVGHVWLAQEPRGAAVQWVPVRDAKIEVDDYAAAIDERTRIVSATHGYFLNGYRQDLGALASLAHGSGALLVVDAYQTLGTCDVDVKALDVDVLAGGVLKYLMGVPGIAFLYVRRELIDQLEPTVTGWFGRANPFAFDATHLDWAATARRFDTGTPPIVNAAIARAGIGIINEVGPTCIAPWIEALSKHCIDGGRARGLTLHGTDDVTRKTPNTAFLCNDSHAVETALRKRGILASARGPVIRLAPHFYSTFDDVDRTLDALVEVLA
jgi:selenocysteine lyase/cysteine desulfurase